jgi:hypothetical protein
MLHPTDTVLRGKYLVALEKQLCAEFQKYESRLNGHAANSEIFRIRIASGSSSTGKEGGLKKTGTRFQQTAI